MILNIKFREILFTSSRAVLATELLSHTDRHTDNHFPKIVKPCSKHLKTCKSIKNRKLKLFMGAIPFFTYSEESKNRELKKEKCLKAKKNSF